MDTTTFAQKLKVKYPEYQNMDDRELVQKVTEKYPVYKSQITDLESDFSSDIKGIVRNTKEDLIKGREQAKATTEAYKSGEQGLGRSIFQGIGQGAKLVSNAIGNTVMGVGKALLPQKAEDVIGETTKNVMGKVTEIEPVKNIIEKYNVIKQTNPALARDIDSALGIGSLALDVAGAGIGAKGAKAGLSATKKGIGATKGAIESGISSAKKVSGEIIPSAERVVNYQVSRALDLTQGDIKNIAKSTGNEVGEFIADKNLIRANKDETLQAIKDFYDKNYTTVRDEINKVNKAYNTNNVPRYRQALEEIQKQVGETTGLEDATKEIKSLLSKEKVLLSDVQRAKELLDEHFSLYKVTGDVKEGVTKTGLANVRKDLKEFIEKEVKDTTGTDISELNNNVMTSRGIADAISTRATRGLTASNIKIGDLGVFGVGSALGSPILGVGAVIAKKIVESSAIRLKIARYLDKVSDARKLKIKNALIKGQMPEEITKIVENQSNLTPNANIKNIKTQNASIK